ncbi:MAG: outer membrane lipoprotein carrier protein LolA [Geminicoccaceae bacterium]|nr:outer membrane lipoprotein carrier protein LolA [Geminicoccaceae bacterium]
MNRLARDRRAVLLSLLACGTAAALPDAAAAAPSVTIAGLEAYLNGISTLRARFSQIAADGSMSTGLFALERPGRLRLDYDPPSGVLLIAPGDWRLVFYDSTIRQVNVIPISKTPLGFLLDDEVRLSGPVTVVDQRLEGDEVGVTLIRSDAPDQGNVTLVFGANPLELRRWAVVDPQGLTTIVILEKPEWGIPLDRELFRWRDPAIFGYPDD